MIGKSQLETEIRSHLEFCRIGHRVAVQRAPLVARILEASKFPLAFHRTLVSTVRVPLVEYGIPDPRSNIHKARRADEILNYLSGTWLDRGDLLFLSIVAEKATKILGPDWIDHFSAPLQNPTQHLDLLNEIWWLTHFHGIENVTHDYKLSPPADIDWRFSSSGCPVNLEVKRRRKDILRAIYGIENSDIFEDIERKFMRDDESINVVAITLYGGIDRFIQDRASKWLRSESVQEKIDALLLWSPFQRSGVPFDMQIVNSKGESLKSIVIRPDIEEESLVLNIMRPIEIPGIPAQ